MCFCPFGSLTQIPKSLCSPELFVLCRCRCHPVADPGFPIGGGVDSAIIQKFCMSKRKNSGSLGGGACAGHVP